MRGEDSGIATCQDGKREDRRLQLLGIQRCAWPRFERRDGWQETDAGEGVRDERVCRRVSIGQRMLFHLSKIKREVSGLVCCGRIPEYRQHGDGQRTWRQGRKERARLSEERQTTAVGQKGSMLYHMGCVEERNVIFQLIDQRE